MRTPNCYTARKWQRRAETITRKLDDLLEEMSGQMTASTRVRLSILNQTSRLVDECDTLVVNLDALAAEVSR